VIIEKTKNSDRQPISQLLLSSS